MSTKAELTKLADELETTGRPGGLCQCAADKLREFADRLDAVAVSDAMVERAVRAANEAILRAKDTALVKDVRVEAIRAELESILPIADEKPR